MLKVQPVTNFKIESLGVQTMDVYDAEVEKYHNFFANDILVHNSNYISLEQIIEKLKLKFNTNKEFHAWSIEFIKTVLNPLVETIMSGYESRYDQRYRVEFLQEKIISAMFITGRKHYVIDLIDKEGKYFDTPVFSATGMETKKRNTPVFIKETLTEVLKMLLRGAEKQDLLDYVKQQRDIYETLPVREIAICGNIKDYKKYEPESLELPIKYIKKCPPRNKAAVNYNAFLKHKDIRDLPSIGNNTLMNYIQVVDNNDMGFDVIGFVGEYPQILKDNFTVDYNSLWESTCMGLLSNWFEVLKWGAPQLQQNSFDDFFS